MPNYKHLQTDGGYGPDINAYSEENSRRKEQFLRDARALLKEVGQHLAKVGMTGRDIRINPGGIAVSGDVYADFWMPEAPEKTVYCAIGASVCKFLGGRQDGVCIMTRTHTRVSQKNGKTWHVRYMGANNWTSPDQDSLTLATHLLGLAGMQAQAEQQESAASAPGGSPTPQDQGQLAAQIPLFEIII